MKKKEHDSSIILKNLRTITKNNLHNKTTENNLLKKQRTWKRKWITAGLATDVGFLITLNFIKINSFLYAILGALVSGVIGFQFGGYYWQQNSELPPTNKEIDKEIIALVQPKLNCGVKRIEEEARVLVEHLKNGTDLLTWRGKIITILQNKGPTEIAKIIVSYKF